MHLLAEGAPELETGILKHCFSEFGWLGKCQELRDTGEDCCAMLCVQH